MMKISAFGDEIAVDFEEQLRVLRRLKIPLIDIRAAWGVNCSQFSDDHVSRVKELCARYEIAVSCMGSPIGKSPIEDPIEIECERLRAVGAVADQLGTRNIRIFSFYLAAGVDESAMQCAIDRLGKLTDIATAMDLQLLLENEKGVVGDLPENCLQLLKAIDSPNFRFIWDPANFVQCGAAEQVDAWWDALHPTIGYIHIKDALLPEGAAKHGGEGEARSAVKVAGQGDGQVKELLANLRDSGYDGVLSLEPHLLEARHSSGFSGADGMEMAVNALRGLMAEVGIAEGR
ncbi:MAG: sugar phosphate isomerase/epimerase [Chloroflexota bacterium]|nr:sugar phosphate isomerase/epimerase [Chloroflexota bacterium]